MNPETNFSIKCLKGGFDNNLSYVVSCSHTGNQVLVDASIELTKIYRYVHQSPVAILITHSHKDHLYYLQEYIKAYPKMAIVGNELILSNPGSLLPPKSTEQLFKDYFYKLLKYYNQ